MSALTRLSLPALAGLMAATAAPAATVTVTGVTGAWTEVTPADTVGLTGIGTAQINWGTPSNPDGLQSGYVFAGETGQSAPAQDTDFALGTFTHNNFDIATAPDPSSITGATLEVTVNLLVDGAAVALTQVYEFLHLETVNQADPCADGGANGVGVNASGCADRVTATQNDGRTETYRIGDQVLTLSLSGFLVDGQLLQEFWTAERGAQSAILVARYTLEDSPSPVPLPASVAMLALALAGLGAARLRRRR